LAMEIPTVGPLAPAETAEVTDPLPEAVVEAENTLMTRLNKTLIDLTSLYTVNSMIGSQNLSLEELKVFVRTENPSRAYLSTLCWWRKALGFLLLYLLILPINRLIFYGSSQSKGAAQNIRDTLITLATDTKKWRSCVNHLFSFMGDTLFEYAAISNRFSPEIAAGKTLEVFRQEELKKRLLERGYDSAKIGEQFNKWLIETINIQSDIPLIGPIITSIVKSCVAGSLQKADVSSHLLSLITDSGQNSPSPVVYELLDSVAYLINQGREVLLTHYREASGEPEIDLEPEINFTTQEKNSHASALSHLKDLPYTEADNIDKVALLNTERSNKRDDSNQSCWPHVQNAILDVAENGAVLLLRLFKDPVQFAHMRVNILEKVTHIFRDKLDDVNTEAFTEVHGRVSRNALDTIGDALENEFSDQRLEERKQFPYKYAAKLVAKMQRETTEALEALRMSLDRAHSPLLPDWKNQVKEAFRLAIRNISILNTRIRYLQQVPQAEPFNQTFSNKLAAQLLSHAAYVEEALTAIKLLAERVLPETEPLLVTRTKIQYLLATEASHELQPLPFANRSKRYLLALQTGLERYINQALLDAIRASIESIEASQNLITRTSSRTAKLQRALALTEECISLTSNITSNGTGAIHRELLGITSLDLLVSQLNHYIGTRDIPRNESIDILLRMQDEGSAEKWPAVLKSYIENLQLDQSKQDRLLTPKKAELEAQLETLTIANRQGYRALQTELQGILERDQQQVTLETALIGRCRAALTTSYQQLDRALNLHLTSTEASLRATHQRLQDRSVLVNQNMSQIIAPKLALSIELSTLPLISSLPWVHHLSRPTIKRTVLAIAERQVHLGRDFISRPDAIAHVIKRFMIMFFCQN
ncbi:MAG: hypothetical protein WCN87_00270, partial [Chlamydiota bacterium]